MCNKHFLSTCTVGKRSSRKTSHSNSITCQSSLGLCFINYPHFLLQSLSPLPKETPKSLLSQRSNEHYLPVMLRQPGPRKGGSSGSILNRKWVLTAPDTDTVWPLYRTLHCPLSPCPLPHTQGSQWGIHMAEQVSGPWLGPGNWKKDL